MGVVSREERQNLENKSIHVHFRGHVLPHFACFTVKLLTLTCIPQSAMHFLQLFLHLALCVEVTCRNA